MSPAASALQPTASKAFHLETQRKIEIVIVMMIFFFFLKHDDNDNDKNTTKNHNSSPAELVSFMLYALYHPYFYGIVNPSLLTSMFW